MLTYIFPGQGSQVKEMGKTLFDEFKHITAQADDILGYSVKKLCIEDPNFTLAQTQYTQPALYVVNALSYLKKIKDSGKKPDYVAGHSLGEYNALLVAGAFEFAIGLKLVQKRGELMSHAMGGGMAAVIGLKEEEIITVLEENNLQDIDIANYNSPSQIVISGLQTDIDRAEPIFERTKGVKLFIRLKTSGAFHSRYMEAAKRKFDAYINSFRFSELMIPVISNVHARPYQQAEIGANLLQQITHPVRWTESIKYLLSLGKMEFEEVGPGRVLTGLVQKIQIDEKPLVITKEDPFLKNAYKHSKCCS
ncbi:ACP S-malonyltransferase [Pelosinus sp. IPA-1]|uniref:ACP S-malonyltransferase n=1 Tax=Pelosinus sp. IPA-1 TaxID=3029569 RepID=UPI002436205E|nr:ACP S-malonyltransferase [Pelosinus sp. IPA-1]GMA97726.1 hypothetical protein PIPA1_05260 [Pelosinus sp. IPA-1]